MNGSPYGKNLLSAIITATHEKSYSVLCARACVETVTSSSLMSRSQPLFLYYFFFFYIIFIFIIIIIIFFIFSSRIFFFFFLIFFTCMPSKRESYCVPLITVIPSFLFRYIDWLIIIIDIHIHCHFLGSKSLISACSFPQPVLRKKKNGRHIATFFNSWECLVFFYFLFFFFYKSH